MTPQEVIAEALTRTFEAKNGGSDAIIRAAHKEQALLRLPAPLHRAMWRSHMASEDARAAHLTSRGRADGKEIMITVETLLASFVRVREGHEDLGEDTYHEWITMGEKVRADINGRVNRRITYRHWQKWICNNTDCAAWALVSDEGVRHLIQAGEERG